MPLAYYNATAIALIPAVYNSRRYHKQKMLYKPYLLQTDSLHVFSWFVLETNYDPWKKPPASDDRRDTALWAMKEVGQARMDLESLYEVYIRF